MDRISLSLEMRVALSEVFRKREGKIFQNRIEYTPEGTLFNVNATGNFKFNYNYN